MYTTIKDIGRGKEFHDHWQDVRDALEPILIWHQSETTVRLNYLNQLIETDSGDDSDEGWVKVYHHLPRVQSQLGLLNTELEEAHKERPLGPEQLGSFKVLVSVANRRLEMQLKTIGEHKGEEDEW